MFRAYILVESYVRILFFAITFLAITILPGIAKAADTDRFSGWAWSSNTGWISFNCNNTNYCNTIEYAVTLTGNEPTQSLSGWAWSPNMGWIDFSGASYNSSTGVISGTALVHSTTVAPYRSGDSEDDGWDGIIDLSGSGAVSWGPTRDGTDNTADGWNWDDSRYWLFDDYAWGDESMGWILFSCQTDASCGTVGYGVFLDPFYFDFTADDGLDSDNRVTYNSSYRHIWNLDPEVSINSCAASGGPGDWSAIPAKNTSPSPVDDSVTGSTNSASSTLTCTHISGKSIPREMFVWVQPPTPTISFVADDSNIPYNTSTLLRWTTTNASSCTLTGGIYSGGAVATGTDITATTNNLTAFQTDYLLKCVSSYPEYAGIEYPSAETVYVEKLFLDFYATDSEGERLTGSELVAYTDRDELDLAWDTEFASSDCVASGDWSGTKVDGTVDQGTGNFTETASTTDDGLFSFVLTCDGTLGQQDIQTVQINIGKNPDFSEEITNVINQ